MDDNLEKKRIIEIPILVYPAKDSMVIDTETLEILSYDYRSMSNLPILTKTTITISEEEYERYIKLEKQKEESKTLNQKELKVPKDD